MKYDIKEVIKTKTKYDKQMRILKKISRFIPIKRMIKNKQAKTKKYFNKAVHYFYNNNCYNELLSLIIYCNYKWGKRVFTNYIPFGNLYNLACNIVKSSSTIKGAEFDISVTTIGYDFDGDVIPFWNIRFKEYMDFNSSTFQLTRIDKDSPDKTLITQWDDKYIDQSHFRLYALAAFGGIVNNLSEVW